MYRCCFQGHLLKYMIEMYLICDPLLNFTLSFQSLLGYISTDFQAVYIFHVAQYHFINLASRFQDDVEDLHCSESG